MSGVHGLTSAHGVRSTVLPAPVRRALLLTALLCGILIAVWSATSEPVRAEEAPPGAGLVRETVALLGQGASSQAPQGSSEEQRTPGRSGQGTTDRTRPDTEPSRTSGASVLPATVTGAAQTSVPQAGVEPVDVVGRIPTAATRLDEPLTETVMVVGEGATRMVLARPAPAVPALASVGDGVTQQVHDMLRTTTGPVEEHLLWSPVPGAAPSDKGRSTARSGNGDGTRTKDQDTAVTREGTGPQVLPLLTDAVATARYDAEPAAEAGSTPLAAEGSAHPTSNSAATGTATGGSVSGTAFAGYLSSISAPAPVSGRLQAAWHVLRSVPAESADEPTFSPD